MGLMVSRTPGNLTDLDYMVGDVHMSHLNNLSFQSAPH